MIELHQDALDFAGSMEAIGLSEMDGVKLMNRIDTKYIFHARDFTRLLQDVSDHYRVLSVNGVLASPYLTLYFDSSSFHSYVQHHNGKLNRYKIRIRQYASSGACFVEVKNKNNKGRTIKKRMPITAIEETLSADSEAFVDSVLGPHPVVASKLWTRFLRMTLVARQVPERVTIDWGLGFHSNSQHEQWPGLMIAEVKQNVKSQASPIRQYLRRQFIRPFRISKYCLGAQTQYPHLKQNRFKVRLCD